MMMEHAAAQHEFCALQEQATTTAHVIISNIVNAGEAQRYFDWDNAATQYQDCAAVTCRADVQEERQSCMLLVFGQLQSRNTRRDMSCYCARIKSVHVH